MPSQTIRTEPDENEFEDGVGVECGGGRRSKLVPVMSQSSQ